MKTLYLECAMGAAGDMLTAALLELYPNREAFLRQINSAGIPGVTVECIPAQRCGVNGSRMVIKVHGEEECPPENGGQHEEHTHSGYSDIGTLIDGLRLPDEVKADAKAVYHLIAEAESSVHGKPVEEIHFHEVGALDAVTDVTAFCLLVHLLNPERIVASPVHVGSGFVNCAHGILPVPTPATTLLLEGVPTYGGKVEGELCTPTGAALLKYYVTRFGDRPLMSVKKTGYGMGSKEFEIANCVRAFWGEETRGVSPDPKRTDAGAEEPTDEIVELSCNLDDMTGEAIGYACNLLKVKGALDVFTTPIVMKKGRPAVMLTCLCTPERSKEFGKLILTHTTTIGVREKRCARMLLRSEWAEVQTDYGPLRVKISKGYGIVRYKPEFEDVKRIAEQSGTPFDEIAAKAYEAVRE